VPGVRLYREALIDLANASALDGGTGRWPDALVPDVDELVNERRNAFPFSVPAGETRALWIELFVPPGTAAGEYAGSVTVSWDGGAATVPVGLTVWPFTLPSTSSLRSAFGFTYGAIPSEHGLGWATRSRRSAPATARSRSDTGSRSRTSTTGGRTSRTSASVYGPALDGTAPTRLTARG